MNKENASKFDISNYVQIGILGVLIVIAFILGSMLQKTGKTTTTPKQKTADTQTVDTGNPTVTLDDVKSAFNKAVIKFGDTNKKVIFLEVSDPSCPYCSIAAGKNGALNKQADDRFILVSDGGQYLAPVPEMRKLADSGEAAFALIYTPGHGNGEMGMKALYCAYEMNKFWQVDDLIMSGAGYDLLNNTIKNDKTKSGVLADFLSTVVDKNTMKQCLDSGKYDSQLTTDTETASSIGVQGTPGFFVNDTNFAGAYGYTDMESAVNKALGK